MNSIERIELDLRNWLTGIDVHDRPELSLVGGVVRDLMLDRLPKDIDFACENANGVAESIARANDARVVTFQKQEQESCYRVVSRKNSQQFLDIAPMQGDTLEEDLSKRDFTINAMAMRVVKVRLGKLIDPFHGKQDLEQKLIRMTTEDVFDRDPVRMVRAFRFAAQLGFQIHSPTLEMIKDKADLLGQSAPERIIAELLLLLRENPCFEIIRLMDEVGILELIIPEISAMQGREQNFFHHKDVWGHSLIVFENCEFLLINIEAFFGEQAAQVREILTRGNRLPLLKLGALLHDLGKPKTKGENVETGRITFYEHDLIGAEMIEALAERQKMSNQDRELLKILVGEHLHVQVLSQPEVKASTRMRFFRKYRDLAVLVIILGLADIKGRLGPDTKPEDAGHFAAWAREVVAVYFQKIKPSLDQAPLINGRDLLELGLKPGPQIGQILEDIQQAQDDGEVLDRKQALELAERLVLSTNLKKQLKGEITYAI
jgi:poly(A) polymerase